MGSVFVGISHKGGTGRSVTMANVAYHLARGGKRVCIVDLDLGSPTMGSVCGVPDMEMGAKTGVHDLIINGVPSAPVIEGMTHSLWDRSTFLRGDQANEAGDLDLLPGTAGLGNMGMNSQQLRGPLFGIIASLKMKYDVVFLDMPSGLSIVARTVGSEVQFNDLVSAWLVFHRWTPQHLAGARDMLERLNSLSPSGAKMYLVRTAYVDPARVTGETRDYVTWLKIQDANLYKECQKLLEAGKVERTLGITPFSGVLQWQEQILTESFLNRQGLRVNEEFTRFADLAENVSKLCPNG